MVLALAGDSTTIRFFDISHFPENGCTTVVRWLRPLFRQLLQALLYLRRPCRRPTRPYLLPRQLLPALLYLRHPWRRPWSRGAWIVDGNTPGLSSPGTGEGLAGDGSDGGLQGGGPCISSN